MDEVEKIMLDERFNCLSQRIEAMETRQKDMEDLISSVAVLAQRMGTVEDNVSEIRGNVRTLMEKPGKRWDGIVDKLIWAALAAGLGFLLAQIGLA